jgi:hypothetical protein
VELHLLDVAAESLAHVCMDPDHTEMLKLHLDAARDTICGHIPSGTVH